MRHKNTSDMDLGVQSLRGIAVVLMVAGHVIGDEPARGMQVADDSSWRLFYRALEDLRMPLFTVLSGFVYGYRPVRGRGDVRGLVVGKSRRLLGPLVVVGSTLFMVKLVVPEANVRPEPGDFWRIFFFGYEHLWFLQSIFLIFLVVGLLDALGAIRTPRAWSTVFAVACLLFVIVHVPGWADVFSVSGALRLLPFFLLGYGMRCFWSGFNSRAFLMALTAALVGVYSVRLHNIVSGGDAGWHPAQVRALSLSVGLLGVTLLFGLRRHLAAPALVWLGGFSFGIYLLHVFGSAGARMLVGDISVVPVVFAVSLAAGLGLPVVFELLFGRSSVVSWSVLGQKPRHPPSRTAPTEAKAPTGDATS